MNHPHVMSVRTNLTVFGALMGLLILTIGAAYINLGPFGVPVALAIATTKAVLIIMYFMHVKFSPRLTAVFSASAFLWLAIMMAFSMADYLSRGWLENIAGK